MENSQGSPRAAPALSEVFHELSVRCAAKGARAG